VEGGGGVAKPHPERSPGARGLGARRWVGGGRGGGGDGESKAPEPTESKGCGGEVGRVTTKNQPAEATKKADSADARGGGG